MLTLNEARQIAENCLALAGEMKLKPITIAVLDSGGHLKALLRQDGTSTMRAEIAQGKARGAIALGMGSRAIYRRAQEQPYFIQAMNALAGGSLVPVPGGVLIRRDGEIVGSSVPPACHITASTFRRLWPTIKEYGLFELTVVGILRTTKPTESRPPEPSFSARSNNLLRKPSNALFSGPEHGEGFWANMPQACPKSRGVFGVRWNYLLAAALNRPMRF